MPWNSFRIVLIAFVVSILLVFPYLGYFYFYEKKCSTEECFLERADNCRPASYENVVGPASIRYNSKRGCELEKTIISLTEKEPEKAKALFEGASMSCAYSRQEFSDAYLKSFSFGVENCRGVLKEIIELI